MKWVNCTCELYLNKTVNYHTIDSGLEKQILKYRFPSGLQLTKYWQFSFDFCLNQLSNFKTKEIL